MRRLIHNRNPLILLAFFPAILFYPFSSPTVIISQNRQKDKPSADFSYINLFNYFVENLKIVVLSNFSPALRMQFVKPSWLIESGIFSVSRQNAICLCC